MMYCRFCGKEIKDDSLFCSYCGKEVDKEQKTESDNESVEIRHGSCAPKCDVENDREDNQSGCLWFVIWLLIVATVCAWCVIATVNKVDSSDSSNSSSSSSNGSIFNKNITSGDYTATTSQGITTYSVTIVPKRDIASCDILVTLYSDEGEKIYADTISKKDLKEGYSYTYTFDFGFLNALSGSKIEYSVTGKRK